MPITVDPEDSVPVYTKDEVDALFANLPAPQGSYTKDEIDAKFASLPVPQVVYTKDEIDAKFANLPVPQVVYTKAEVDAKLASLQAAILASLPPSGYTDTQINTLVANAADSSHTPRFLLWTGTGWPDRPKDSRPTVFVGGTTQPNDPDLRDGDLWVQ